MPRPVVTDSAEELHSRLGPWRDADEEQGPILGQWFLLEMTEAIMARLQPINDVIRDDLDTGDPGWSAVLDADRAPLEWLQWLSQFPGKRLPPGLDEDSLRHRIKSTDGLDRGKPDAIRAAPYPYLTGTHTVYLIERHGSPWRLTVATLSSETPDPDAVLRAIMEQKPGGIIMDHAIVVGGDYNTLRDLHASYNAVKTLFVNYDEVKAHPDRT